MINSILCVCVVERHVMEGAASFFLEVCETLSNRT